MIVYLNPSRPRVWRIIFEPDNQPEQSPVDIESDYWQEALAWWWSGQNIEVFGTLQDVPIEYGSALAGIITLYLDDPANNAFDMITIQDVTEEVYPSDNVVSCAELVEQRKAERIRKRLEQRANRKSKQLKQV
jgi:hypothetical protein